MTKFTPVARVFLAFPSCFLILYCIPEVIRTEVKVKSFLPVICTIAKVESTIVKVQSTVKVESILQVICTVKTIPLSIVESILQVMCTVKSVPGFKYVDKCAKTLSLKSKKYVSTESRSIVFSPFSPWSLYFLSMLMAYEI